MASFVAECIEALAGGTHTPPEIAARIRAKYSARNTLARTFTAVRNGVYAQNARPAGYKAATEALRLRLQATDVSPACRRHVLAFLNESRLGEQYAMRRGFRSAKWECGPVPEGVGALLLAVPLVPAGFEALALTKDEQGQRSATSAANKARRSFDVVRLSDAETEEVLAWVRATLSEAAHALPQRRTAANALLAGLLVASGRRSIEILNGRSRFEPVAGHPTLARFFGQVKKDVARKRRIGEAPADAPVVRDDGYVIPLVAVDYATFAGAYATFCGVQRERWTRRGVKDYAKQEFDAFGGQGRAMNTWLVQRGADTSDRAMRLVDNKHALRALYVALAQRGYSRDVDVNLFVQIVLGHENPYVSTHYLYYVLDGASRGPQPLFPPTDLRAAIMATVVPPEGLGKGRPRQRPSPSPRRKLHL